MTFETAQNDIRQYLTFKLVDETYAINVGNIREVLAIPRITRVPRMPAFMSGVINLRGNVIPVLDLRMKFGLGKTPIGENTSIIVTELGSIFADGEDESFTVGLFSDSVEEVVTLDEGMIEPPPKIGATVDTEFIVGMGRIGGEFMIVLDIDKLLSENELMVAPAEELNNDE